MKNNIKIKAIRANNIYNEEIELEKYLNSIDSECIISVTSKPDKHGIHSGIQSTLQYVVIHKIRIHEDEEFRQGFKPHGHEHNFKDLKDE